MATEIEYCRTHGREWHPLDCTPECDTVTLVEKSPVVPDWEDQAQRDEYWDRDHHPTNMSVIFTVDYRVSLHAPPWADRDSEVNLFATAAAEDLTNTAGEVASTYTDLVVTDVEAAKLVTWERRDLDE